MFKKKRISLLATYPQNDDTLSLIEEFLRMANLHREFGLQPYQVSIQTALAEHLRLVKPQTGHFSGRGSLTGIIPLEDDQGQEQVISLEHLENLFTALKGC